MSLQARITALAQAVGADIKSLLSSLAGKQAALVSGTNIKTVNGSSLLGAGDLTVADRLKAWVNFNGSGTVAIRASYNVSSITDNGVGDYTVNFSSAMSDANYAVLGTSSRDSGESLGRLISIHAASAAPSTTAVRVYCQQPNTSGGDDNDYVCVGIFR